MDVYGDTKAGRRNRRRKSEGRGVGSGRTYKPQLKTHDVPSLGRSTRMPIDGRMAHLLSDLETRLMLELRWADEFSDIREQVPLPLERTLQIAEEIGARHPTVPGDYAPVVMTTDIVCQYTGTSGSIVCARAVKQSQEIDARFLDRLPKADKLLSVLGSLEIEKRYWQGIGADWRFVCEHDLDRIRAANIQLLLSWGGLDPAHGPTFWEEALDLAACTVRRGEDRRLSQIGERLESDGKLSRAHFMDCIRHLCATRQFAFDMSQHFGPDLRACDFQPGSG